MLYNFLAHTIVAIVLFPVQLYMDRDRSNARLDSACAHSLRSWGCTVCIYSVMYYIRVQYYGGGSPVGTIAYSGCYGPICIFGGIVLQVISISRPVII